MKHGSRLRVGLSAARWLAVPALLVLATARIGRAADNVALDLAQLKQNAAWQPPQVTLAVPTSFPVTYAGRVAGQTLVPAGTPVRLIRLAGAQLEVDHRGARCLVDANSTDVLARATRLRDAALATRIPGESPGSFQPPGFYRTRAIEVAEEIQKDFWMPARNLYADQPGSTNPDVVWSAGVMFSALVAAARNDPDHYRPFMDRYFTGLHVYWDRK